MSPSPAAVSRAGGNLAGVVAWLVACLREHVPDAISSTRKAVQSSDMTAVRFDAILPPEIARRAADVGVAKADLSASSTFVLAVLGGAFIALGAVFATTVGAGASAMPYGVGRLLTGLAFCLGLVLVVVAGAELFTGNNLIVMAWASRRLPLARLVRNWLIVFIGNFAGACATAVVMYLAGQHLFGDGA